MAAMMVGMKRKRPERFYRPGPFVLRLPVFPSSLAGLRRALHRDARDRRGLRRLGPGDRAGLGGEAALESAVDFLFDELGLLVRDLGDLRDDEELGAIEHPLFAEREVLGPGEEGQ